MREGAGQKTVVGYKPGVSTVFVDRSLSGVTDFSSLFSTRHEAQALTENGRLERMKNNNVTDRLPPELPGRSRNCRGAALRAAENHLVVHGEPGGMRSINGYPDGGSRNIFG
ncbi:hypothetical protein BSK59_20025 [Paenibacillus odorifer]|uniref:GH32 C-terminal domain-containing protein n=1 Tax=Paenibacillus TaxID=44249 RepID=UPI00096FECE8|nr:GH32 C-terminal domain-containing protein [Paenibacillus odorifer]OME51811.1 hypothetical protein BSK59_20025 [Paenibacillus odorifer]